MSVPHVRVPRSEFSDLDPLWGGREPFDSRSARLDLRQMASYTPRSVVSLGVMVELDVGDLVVSERQLERRWGWSRGRVGRFLSRLADAHWLCIKQSRPQYHLTINDIACYPDLCAGDEATKKPRTGPRTKKESSREVPSPKGEVPKETRGRASKRVPADFPNADEERELEALARECGVDWDQELAQMRDYEFRNPRSDWLATARNWVRRAGQHHGRFHRNGNGKEQTVDDVAVDLAQRIADARR